MKLTKLFFCLAFILAITVGPALAAKHTVGLGAGVAPDYEGSDDYQGIPMLMLTGKYDSGRSFALMGTNLRVKDTILNGESEGKTFYEIIEQSQAFALMGTNLRVNVLPDNKFQLGPILNYRMGRDDVDNKVVDRMKDIDDAVEVGAYVLADLDNVLLGVDFLMDVSGEHDGMLVLGNVGYRWKVSEALVVTPNVFLTYADDDYMDTYFGIDSGNVGTSGLPRFQADSGLKDFGARVVASYAPWEKWGVMGILSYSTLLNDAKDSPIVDDEGDNAQAFFGLMATYRWGN